MLEQLAHPSIAKSKLSEALDSTYPKNAIGLRVVDDELDVLDLKKRTEVMMKKGQNADLVIFLDNGARVLGGLFNKAFSYLYPDRAKPDLKFLNIGREKIKRFFVYGSSPHSTEDFQNELEELISDKESLIRMYGFNAVKQLEDVLSQGKRRKTKEILVVDDVTDRGKTAIFASHILKILYPQSHVEHFSFMHFPDIHLSFTIFDSCLTLGSGREEMFVSGHNHPLSSSLRLTLSAKKEDLAKIAQSCAGDEVCV